MLPFVTLFENEYTLRGSHEIDQHQQKFEKLIEKSKLFIFYLSQSFQDEKTCMDQLSYAIKLNKKVFYLIGKNNHDRLNSSVDLSKWIKLDFKQENQERIKNFIHLSFLRYFENYIHVGILKLFFKYRKTPHIVPRTDSTFFLFLGVTSGILCATVYFFFNYFGSIFTQLRPGHRPQKIFLFFSKKFDLSTFWIIFF
jgi:hypothetical protein